MKLLKIWFIIRSIKILMEAFGHSNSYLIYSTECKAKCWCHQTGSMWSDGRISIGQCDLVESWDNLSVSQKKNLNYRYQMGCECRVSKDCQFSMHTYLSFSHSSVCVRRLHELRLKKQCNSCYSRKATLLICSCCFASFPSLYIKKKLFVFILSKNVWTLFSLPTFA